MPPIHSEKMDAALSFFAVLEVITGEALMKTTPAIKHAYEDLSIIANLEVYSSLLNSLLGSAFFLLLMKVLLIMTATNDMTWLRTWTEGVDPTQVMGEYAMAPANVGRMPFSYGLIPTQMHLTGLELATIIMYLATFEYVIGSAIRSSFLSVSMVSSVQEFLTSVSIVTSFLVSRFDLGASTNDLILAVMCCAMVMNVISFRKLMLFQRQDRLPTLVKPKTTFNININIILHSYLDQPHVRESSIYMRKLPPGPCLSPSLVLGCWLMDENGFMLAPPKRLPVEFITVLTALGLLRG